MTAKTKPFDAAKYFQADEEQIELIAEALHSGDKRYIAAAIGTVAKARGIADIAE